MNQKTLVLSLPVGVKSSKITSVFIGLSLLSFVVPFSLGHPQWLVGTIVNAGLFLAAIFLPRKYFIPLVVFPSLGVLARGLVFGPFTPFLVYFLPFIWLGNLILILSFKKLYKFNYLFSLICSSVLKFLFLALIANICFNFKIVPAPFLQVMGIFQLLTALTGGVISLIIFNAWRTQQRRIQKNF